MSNLRSPTDTGQIIVQISKINNEEVNTHVSIKVIEYDEYALDIFVPDCKRSEGDFLTQFIN
jgi:hypothetical protein